MDPSTPRPTGIPRLSRLPVPRAGLHPAASRENLQQLARSSANVVNPRLRATPAPSKFRTSVSPLRRDPGVPIDNIDTSKEPHELWERNDSATDRRPSLPFLPAEDRGGSDLSGEENGAHGEDVEPASSRRPRQSLSERTMETLQNIPASPAVRRRKSSFFNADSPVRPSQSSRPGSSYQNDTSMGPPLRSANSRPTSSSGPDKSIPVDFRASTNTFWPLQPSLTSQTPVKRPTNSKPLKTPSSVRGNKAPVPISVKQQSPSFNSSLYQQSPNPIKSGSKTFSSRSVKPRASVNGLFRKPSMPAMNDPNELDRIGYVKKKKSTTFSNTSSEAGSIFSRASNATAATTVSEDEQNITPRKSSLALRDQIAKAKAAKRAAAAKSVPRGATGGIDTAVIPESSFDFGLSDPFNTKINENGSKGLLRKRVSAARADGRLNIAAMSLKEIPEEVLNMYDLESLGAQDGSWAESVDLTRFIAADNDLELIRDDVFPDIDPRESADDEDAKGNQFGGLETMDLHGNVLATLPLGLRRLELLTTLNLVSHLYK
jgi:hypothetical protein